MDETNVVNTEIHKKMAIELFNGTWTYIDKQDRTADDDLAMIHSAHASRYHWGLAGGPVEWLRGEWQISRVYSLLKMGDSAMLHAQACLRLCQAQSVGGFDLAFAHEAIARAAKLCGDAPSFDQHKALAQQACDAIADAGDRDYTQSEINSL